MAAIALPCVLIARYVREKELWFFSVWSEGSREADVDHNCRATLGVEPARCHKVVSVEWALFALTCTQSCVFAKITGRAIVQNIQRRSG